MECLSSTLLQTTTAARAHALTTRLRIFLVAELQTMIPLLEAALEAMLQVLLALSS